MPRVSLIIPTLNEAKYLGRTLAHLSILSPPAAEIIVVDGGSEDETVAIAETMLATIPAPTQVKLLHAPSGRAIQMNHGAAVAEGEIVCFLHGDTFVPSDLVEVMIQSLKDPAIVAGGFISLMRGSLLTRWSVSLHNYLKTYYAPLLFRPHLFWRGLRLLFGDQVIFCRRADFWSCCGFDPQLPIMEEADLCLKLVKKGKIRLINRVVESSDRRVARWGTLKATGIYLYIGFLWGLGVSPTYLKRFYEEVR